MGSTIERPERRMGIRVRVVVFIVVWGYWKPRGVSSCRGLC